MSQPFQPLSQPATAADVPAEWIAKVSDIIRRDRHLVRAGHPDTIEVQFLSQPDRWQPLNLPTNTAHFATTAERDAVLAQLGTH